MAEKSHDSTDIGSRIDGKYFQINIFIIFFFVLKYASKKISYCDLATVIYSVTDLQQVNKKMINRK